MKYSLLQTLLALLAVSSTESFSVNSHRSALTTTYRFNSALSMSEEDDKIASLREAAAKAREEAERIRQVSPMMMLCFDMRFACVFPASAGSYQLVVFSFVFSLFKQNNRNWVRNLLLQRQQRPFRRNPPKRSRPLFQRSFLKQI